MTGNASGSVQIDRDEVERTIIAIVSRHRGYPEDKIKFDTDLVMDLGIAGDDADPILFEIMKTYPFDFSQATVGARFGSEGLWPWQIPVLLVRILIYPIQRWVLGQSRQEILGHGVLVGDLVDTVMDASKRHGLTNA